MTEDNLNYSYRAIFDRLPGVHFIGLEDVHGKTIKEKWFVEGDIVVLVIPPHPTLLAERIKLEKAIVNFAGDAVTLLESINSLESALEASQRNEAALKGQMVDLESELEYTQLEHEELLSQNRGEYG